MDKLSDCSAKLPPLDRARLSHAYIISAPASESEELAVQLAALMLCRSGCDRPCGVCSDCRKAAAGTHPDIIRIERLPDDKGRPGATSPSGRSAPPRPGWGWRPTRPLSRPAAPATRGS